MSIALVGASRAGKTTLGRVVAEAMGLPFVESRAGNVFSDLGLRVGQDLSFDQRLAVQESILDVHLADLDAAGINFVADRSALDMLAYTYADLGARCPPDGEARLGAYMERCLKVASTRYSMMVLIPPGLPYVAAEGKPAASESYQELIHTLIFGWLRDPRVCCPAFAMARGILDLEDRKRIVLEVWESMLGAAMDEHEGWALH